MIVDRLREDGVAIVAKAGPFWSFLDILIRAVTFGRNTRFLTDYYTTIGNVIAVPLKDWPTPSEEVLVHEAVHVRRFRRLGFGNAAIGTVVAFFVYLLLPLPIGLAYGRFWFEREAYVVQFQHLIERGVPRDNLVDFAVEQLGGPAYAWAWPRPWVRAYFDRHLPKSA